MVASLPPGLALNFALFQCEDVTSPDEKWQCVRVASMTALSFATWLACVIHTVRTLYTTREPLSAQLVIFYFALGETTMCVLHWTALPYTYIDIIMEYQKAGLYSVVCFYYVYNVLRALKLETHINKTLKPVFMALFLIITVITGLALGGLLDSTASCTSPTWLVLSTINLTLASGFVASAYVLADLMNKKNVSEKYRDKAKSNLLTLVVVNFVTAVFSFGYDLFLKVTVKSPDECDSYFAGTASLHVITYIVIRTIDLLVPIWGCLFVFLGVKRDAPSVKPVPVASPIRSSARVNNAALLEPNYQQGPFMHSAVNSSAPFGSPIFGPPSYGSTNMFDVTNPSGQYYAADT